MGVLVEWQNKATPRPMKPTPKREAGKNRGHRKAHIHACMFIVMATPMELCTNLFDTPDELSMACVRICIFVCTQGFVKLIPYTKLGMLR